MATVTAIEAQNEQELLHELAKHTYEPRKDDFSRIGKTSVYNLPLRSDRPVSFDGYNYTGEEGIMRGMNLFLEPQLLHLLSERFGIPLRHNSLGVNFEACYSPNGQIYKEKVLTPFVVWTGELIQRLSNGYDISRVEGTELVAATVNSDHVARQGKVINPQVIDQTVRRYNVGPTLQTEMPTETGYFTQFKGVIPVDREITKERPRTGRRGYWNGSYPDDKGVSAVGCGWGSGGQGLYADAVGPLGRYDVGALGIGTEASLNK